MTYVPAGDFYYGPEAGGNNWTSVETLPHFLIDVHEVTAGEYEACVDAGVCSYGAGGSGYGYATYSTYNNYKDTYPINYVNWQEAVDYCTWKGKRLPTEFEWEKAARDTDGRICPWGDEAATCDYAVTSCGGIQDVGTRESGKSRYGAYDMAGNVWEWRDSWYASNQSHRILRGGSFDADVSRLRSSTRETRDPSSRSFNYGFSCSR